MEMHSCPGKPGMTAAAALAILLSGCGDERPAADQPAADHVAADTEGAGAIRTDSLPLTAADSDSHALPDTSGRGTPIGDPGAVHRPEVRLPRPAPDSSAGGQS